MKRQKTIFISGIFFLVLFSGNAFAKEGASGSNNPVLVAKNKIKAAIKSRAALAKKCYAQSLDKDNKIKGVLEVLFTIDDKGKLTSIESNREKSTIQDENLLECVKSIYKNSTLPASAFGTVTTVVYPFKFGEP